MLAVQFGPTVRNHSATGESWRGVCGGQTIRTCVCARLGAVSEKEGGPGPLRLREAGERGTGRLVFQTRLSPPSAPRAASLALCLGRRIVRLSLAARPLRLIETRRHGRWVLLCLQLRLWL